jgi:hypothetical protein
MRPRAQLFSALVLTLACEKYELISLTEQYSRSFFHGRKAEQDTCSAIKNVRGPQKEIALAKPKRAKIMGKYIYYRVYAKFDMKTPLKDLPKLDVSPEEVIALTFESWHCYTHQEEQKPQETAPFFSRVRVRTTRLSED